MSGQFVATATFLLLVGCASPRERAHKTALKDYQRTGIETLAGESKRTVEATYKMLQRVRQALQRCVENAAQHEETAA